MTHKQVIIIRRDLKMRRGKEIAQGAHASLGAILGEGNIVLDDDGNYEYRIKLDQRSLPWLQNAFTKICVTVDSEEEIRALQAAAEATGLINCLITDSGRTEFNGVPTVTTLAIGPDKIEKVNAVTSHLKLY